MRNLLIILFVFMICTNIQAQKSDSRMKGKEYAEKQLEIALINNAGRNRMNEKLFPDEKIALEYAELILFNQFDKEMIEFQKPYQIYLIDDYWVIYGTLPKGYKGGVFHVIFDSWNGQIKRFYHGK